jgi:hypothetical protein
MSNDVRFETILAQIHPDQRLSGIPTQQHFIPHGAYQLSLVGGQEVLQGELLPPEGNEVLYGAVWAATRMLAEMQKRQRSWNMAFASMRDNIRGLAREVSDLKCEIQRLQQSHAYVVPLTTLAPSPFRMVQQIPVTIEGDGEDFTATFVEANVSASGETEADAIANFKASLLSSYELLESLPPNQLGPLPTRQWDILQDVVKRTD